jgi:hypothetical protein
MMQGPGWVQFQTSADATAMSAFLPLATTERTSLEVRFVPKAEALDWTIILSV